MVDLLKVFEQKKIEFIPPNQTGEIVLDCPYCGKQKHLYFNIGKKIGHCKRCNIGLNLFQLLKKLNLLVSVKKVISKKNIIEKVEQVKFPEYSVPVQDSKLAIEYLEKRNILLDEAIKRKMRYCYAGDYFGRILVPYFEKDLIFFVARDISGESERKYLFSKGTKVSHYLYNLAQQENKRVVLVEGVFPAIQFNYVTTFGCHLSDVQIGKLYEKNFKEVVILWDADAENQTKRIANKLRGSFSIVKPVFLEKGQPDNYTEEELDEKIENADVWGNYSF